MVMLKTFQELHCLAVFRTV